MITPTIGRRVWYHPSAFDVDQQNNSNYLVASDPTQPLDAGIAYVWNDRMVNLTVADQNGNMRSRTSVRLLQDDEQPNEGEAYAQWMPYQVAQSKPTESAPAPAVEKVPAEAKADLVSTPIADATVAEQTAPEVVAEVAK